MLPVMLTFMFPVMLSVALLSACSFMPEEMLTEETTEGAPSVVLSAAVYTVALKGKEPMTMESPMISLYNNSRTVQVAMPVFSHEKDDGSLVQGSALSGSYNANTKTLSLIGSVILDDGELGLKLTGSQLSWMLDVQQIVSTAPVTVVFGSGSTINGNNLSGSLESGRFVLTNAEGWIVP